MQMPPEITKLLNTLLICNKHSDKTTYLLRSLLTFAIINYFKFMA